VCEERGIKLSYMPFMVKACSLALTQFPIINSSIDIQVIILISDNVNAELTDENHDITVLNDKKRVWG
jgi:pyruvate/2-oxoglutarate dehydrogenase complex dihydrolipoamide acyltransferase (E2) component